jgi:hypothetical protein
MLRTLSRKFKPIFVKIKKSRLKIIKSSGLVPLYNFMLKTPLKEIIDEEFFDTRNQKLIKYLTNEFLISIILRLIDGSIRLYHFRNKVNNNFFTKLFEIDKVPHFTTLIYFLKRNNYTAHKYLSTIMLRVSKWILIQEIKIKKLDTITIDIDATAGSVYGKQEGAEKGYNPEKKGQAAYQLQVWTIRETKTLLKVELRNGSVHCSKGFLDDLKILIPELKKLGVKIRLIADSGYEKYEVFDYLEKNEVGFIFAQRQRKSVKTSGKWAKNKETSLKYDCTLKERFLTYREKNYRQIFIQVDRVYDEHGQLCFVDFLADEFTNVFATNMDIAAENIYGLYREHAQVETIICELKSRLGSVKGRSHSFNVNQSLTQLCGIAYNIKTLYASQILKYSNGEIPDIQTIRDNELHVPGYFANHGGKNVFNVIAGSFKDFSRIYELVNDFQPLSLMS